MGIEEIRGDDPDHFRIALARASSRARFVLRMLSGSLRTSSPSLTRISKA